MQSKLAERLHLRYEPAAILFSDEKPSDARTYPDVSGSAPRPC